MYKGIHDNGEGSGACPISFRTLLNAIGGMGVFFLFGGLALVALTYFAEKVPETKARAFSSWNRT
jgi:hypothetical protein